MTTVTELTTPRVRRELRKALAGEPRPVPALEAGRAMLLALVRGIIDQAAWEQSPSERLLREIEDWCRCGWPQKWPLPGPWSNSPSTSGGLTGWQQEALLGAGLTAGLFTERYPEGNAMREAFDRASRLLMEASMTSLATSA